MLLRFKLVKLDKFNLSNHYLKSNRISELLQG
ncbi:MAG: hypothetical protein ACJATL_001113 [Rickettsiales bacterium]